MLEVSQQSAAVLLTPVTRRIANSVFRMTHLVPFASIRPSSQWAAGSSVSLFMGEAIV